MWLVVLLLALRAFVPSGFMPSVDALRDGRFEMVICSGTGGMRTIVVDSHGELVTNHRGNADGDNESDSQDDQSLHLEQCPFGAMASAVPLPSLAPTMQGAVLTATITPLAIRNDSRPPMPAQGPPLGSRAPPSILG
ncbi:hypothetical protein BH09PSE5_BH09PSE5_05030 [soil metagenome]